MHQPSTTRLFATGLACAFFIASHAPAEIPATQPATRPTESVSSDRFVKARAQYATATQACLAKLHESDDYKTAEANLETAKANRAAATGEDIPAAAQALMVARTAVSKLEQGALAHDPAVVVARRELDAATIAGGGADRAALPTLNHSILLFAEQSVGKVIGNGECWTLGHDAVVAAHAQLPDTYVWGRELKPDETVLPGDIMQFTSARFEGPGWWYQMGEPNHTAIVQKVQSKTVYWILGQNPGPVVSKKIDFAFLKSGSYKVYRPLPQ